MKSRNLSCLLLNTLLDQLKPCRPIELPHHRNMSQHIGSVFLGDVQRQRILSTSTPPSSPPPHIGTSSTPSPLQMAFMPESLVADLDMDATASESGPKITPEVSLDLRLRWLETLLFGARSDIANRHPIRKPDAKGNTTLVRGVEDLQRRLDAVVQSSEGLKRFMDHCGLRSLPRRYSLNHTIIDEQHAHLLNPTFALSGTLSTSPPSYENMTPAEVEAFLTEMEPDIRAADRDLREIELLEKKDIFAAGKLSEYETLQPRLDALMKAHEEDLHKAADLEKRIADIMNRYATNVGIGLAALRLEFIRFAGGRAFRAVRCVG